MIDTGAALAGRGGAEVIRAFLGRLTGCIFPFPLKKGRRSGAD